MGRTCSSAITVVKPARVVGLLPVHFRHTPGPSNQTFMDRFVGPKR